MNQTLKRKLFLVLLLPLSFFLHAQQSNFSGIATLGIGSQILDESIAVHAGFNPSWALNPSFSIEGQASYIHTQINGSFLSGRMGTANAFNLLLGGRLYLIPKDKKNRAYINVLIGGRYSEESLEGLEQNAGLGLGFSGGAYLEVSKFVVGLSYDTPQHLFLKLGYTF